MRLYVTSPKGDKICGEMARMALEVYQDPILSGFLAEGVYVLDTVGQ